MKPTPMRRYEAELSRFDERRSRETLVTCDAEVLIAKVARFDADPSVVFVAWLSQGADHGNFYLWRRHGRALVRLDEHREHFASQPDHALTGTIEFVDEDGTTFVVDAGETVDAEAGLAALHHWLRTGEMTPGLAWT
jgi:hypothetical protein